MTVSAVLVYELHGASNAQSAALRRALARLPTFRSTQLHNTWEIESSHVPNLHATIERAFRELLDMCKIQEAHFQIYTARDLYAGARGTVAPPSPRPRSH